MDQSFGIPIDLSRPHEIPLFTLFDYLLADRLKAVAGIRPQPQPPPTDQRIPKGKNKKDNLHFKNARNKTEAVSKTAAEKPLNQEMIRRVPSSRSRSAVPRSPVAVRTAERPAKKAPLVTSNYRRRDCYFPLRDSSAG
ncbi:unnamed protein product, partial [Iphiclides podalirius]